MEGSIDKAAWISFTIETIVSSNLLHNEIKKKNHRRQEGNDAMSDTNYFS